MKKSILSCLAAVALAASMFTPARAATYNAIFQTNDQVNGFNFNLALTTDAGNNLTGASGTITGLGTNVGYSGTVTGIELPGSNALWNWDNKFSATSPYFTLSGCCSGIVLDWMTAGYGADAVNLYADLSANLLASFAAPGGQGYNPGFDLNKDTAQVAATPLPASALLFGSGLGLLALMRKKKPRYQLPA